jgi:hypothetical protein
VEGSPTRIRAIPGDHRTMAGHVLNPYQENVVPDFAGVREPPKAIDGACNPHDRARPDPRLFRNHLSNGGGHRKLFGRHVLIAPHGPCWVGQGSDRGCVFAYANRPYGSTWLTVGTIRYRDPRYPDEEREPLGE